MEIILHLGAHRTGTTTLQDYLRRHTDVLRDRSIGYWGPRRTRNGVFRDVQGDPDAKRHTSRGAGSVASHLDRTAALGVKTLLISDENMIGSVRGNLRSRTLYPCIGDRIQRFAQALDHRISRVMISPRSLEYYWTSCFAYGVSRGHRVPDVATCRQIARSDRSWRDVIADLAEVLPGVEIRVLPFENVVGRPETLLRLGAGIDGPQDRARAWLNPAPGLPELRRVLAQRCAPGQILPFGMGRWNPFTPDDTAALRERYADDMMWLAAGANGLARLTEDRVGDRAGTTPPPDAQTQGQDDERQEGSMA
jgi:hypothetical protein